MSINRVVLATTNAKKLTEMRRLLVPLGIEIADVDLRSAPEIDETGKTFAENAALKAVGQAKHFGELAIGEDSGLVVPALGGEPGIYSARYAGKTSSDQKTNDEGNNDLLLQRMRSLKGEQRAAYYVSSIVLADPTGKVLVTAEDRCEGLILPERKGAGGFGYDPLFLIREYHQTFAEMSLAVKTVISHRGRSLRSFIQKLRSM
jgi:XTP/dITP diphosphohydrolase